MAQWSVVAWGAAALLTLGTLSGCNDGSGGTLPGDLGAPPVPGGTSPPSGTADSTFESPQKTARFLTQATFGPTPEDVTALTGSNAANWIESQVALAPTLHTPFVASFLQRPQARNEDGNVNWEGRHAPIFAFWRNSITARDQLRQRMAFALSQILVVSIAEGSPIGSEPMMLAQYQDILTRNALGNYRDLLQEVTYSPAMANYLTYLQSRRANPNSGQMPDENYARELMQLFTIGLVELTLNGEEMLDGDGHAIETYDNTDITGLARVFTGLSYRADRFYYRREDLAVDARWTPLQSFPDYHEMGEKTFLDLTIPPNTGPDESIRMALDHIFAHPNVAPFVSRQLIQRLVTSDPSPSYVGRVASAFEAGAYTLPNGTTVGDGRRGDLAATAAAILMDPEARTDTAREGRDFGKVREPIIRLTNFARAFHVGEITPWENGRLWDTSSPDRLSQGPYRSPSVFNFYRPGYVAPGTLTGDAGLTMPEMQLVNASAVAGYTNYMAYHANGYQADRNDPAEAASFVPDYSDLEPLIGDPQALVDAIDLRLTYGSMSDETKAALVETIAALPADASSGGIARENLRIKMAVMLAMVSPDYLVQR